MILATVSTRHYDFTAVGADASDAERLLLTAWAKHADETDADPDMMGHMLTDGDVNMTPVDVGTVLRDGEVFTPTGLTWVTSGTAEHVHDDSVDDSPVCGATSGTLSDDPRVEYTCVACRAILAADALRYRSGR